VLLSETLKPLEKKSVATAADPSANSVDFKIVTNDHFMSLLSDMTVPRETERIGERIGAMSIDPITTDTFSAMIPRVAMIVERMTRKKNGALGEESLMRSSIAAPFSFSVMLSKSEKFMIV